MGQGSAEGTPVLDRGVSEQSGRVADDAAVLLNELVVVYVAMAGEGADGQVVTLVPNVAQVL